MALACRHASRSAMALHRPTLPMAAPLAHRTRAVVVRSTEGGDFPPESNLFPKDGQTPGAKPPGPPQSVSDMQVSQTKAPSSSKAPVKPPTLGGREWMLQQPGICAPTGYFDPLGFTANTSFTVDEAKRFRESEVTHGRVAMLAALGWFVAEEFHPLFGGNIGGPAFVHFQKVVMLWPQFPKVLLFAIFVAEGYRLGRTYNDPRASEQIKSRHTPGELDFDPLGLYPSDKAAQYDIKTRELNNGRLAMIAIAGFAAQEERDHTTIWRGIFGSTDVAPPAAFPPYN